MTDYSALLDQRPLAPSELVHLEELSAAVLATSHDVIIMQGEAILALEAVAKSVGAPGVVALNIVTGPYGAIFGDWMADAGATVVTLASEFDSVISVEAVAAAIAEHSPSVLAIVQAEAATGGTNPLVDILALAHAADILTIVDSVAAIGAEPVLVDDWGIDVAVIGGQKSLAGPAGVSAVSISSAAWALIDSNLGAPRGSSLSLTDWRDNWTRTDRSAIPGMPSWLESRGLIAALERVLAEGLDAVNERHRRARAATLAGAAALGIGPWQVGSGYAPVVTALRLPSPGALSDGDLGGILSVGNGALRGHVVRVNHTGRGAALEPVQDALTRLATALGVDPTASLAAAEAAWKA